MVPLHFMWLSNRYAYSLEQEVKLDQDKLGRCRKAMAGAVGGRRGQYVSADRCFNVDRFGLGIRPCQGGVWQVSRPGEGELARFAVCRDREVQTIIWTAAHVGWDTIVSRPVNAPPPLPWSVNAIATGVTSWGGEHRLFPGASEHLAVAWWQMYEAGAIGR